MTRSELLAAVQLNHLRDDKAAVARVGLELAVDDLLKVYDFEKLLMTQDSTISTDDDHVAFPEGMSQLLEVRYIRDLNSYVIPVKDRQQVLRDYPNATAVPSTYPWRAYVEGGQLYWVPRNTFDGAIIRMSYISRPSWVSDDEELSPTIPNLDRYFISYATSWVFDSLQAFQISATWMSKAMSALQGAIEQQRRRPANDTRKEFVETTPERSAYNPNDPFVGFEEQMRNR